MGNMIPAGKAKLLIVEDSPYLLRLYSEEFVDDGYLVRGCLDGQQALKIMKEHNDIDVVILDAKIPVMDGRELCRKLKKYLPKIPVIVNSAYDHLEKDYKRAGAEEYIIKSSNLSYLKNTVKKFLVRKENICLSAHS